jgi:ATP-dependent Lhr-like helicase
MTIPNGRKLRARLVQVCKTFGILQRGIDPRRVNLQGIINRYRGTVVLDEALDKLFHDQMDIDATVALLEAIQAGAVKIEQTPSGALGISPRSERDLLLPNWSDAEVRVRLEERLVNERAVLICLACGSRIRTRVAMYGAKHTHCECGGTMLAATREGLEDMLAGWVASEDLTVQARMEKNAHIVRQRGIEALICLMARGVGEETASRILNRVPKGERELMLKIIHDAELNYARTRRFWA